jgi:outer membrane usher protein
LRAPTYHILVAALALLGAAAARAEPPPGFTEAVLEVSVNARGGGHTLVVLRDADGKLYLEAGDFARLNLVTPTQGERDSDGHRYFPLAALPRVALDFDAATQHLDIKAPPEAFQLTRESAPQRVGPRITPSDPGAFLNYQLSDQSIDGQRNAGELLELGLFNRNGVLTASGVARQGSGTDEAIRLDTVFTHDFVSRLETVNVGDTISDPGSWGNAVRFGGLRWATNFGIRPDLLTTPLLTTGGTAVVPSTVDVFVNNQRVSSTSVPPGPFVIDNVPTVSGGGDVSVVVRDALGREQVVTQSFYTGITLLAPGLSQYSVDLGKIRDDYAIYSNHYGALTGDATYRRGITDSLTVEGHAEFLAHDAHAVGVQVASGIDTLGIVTATVAGGGDGNGQGVLTGVGFERREKTVSAVLNFSYATDGFRQVGDETIPGLRFRTKSVAQLGFDVGRAGTLAAAAVLETYRDSPQLETLSLTDSVPIGPRGSLSLTLSRTTSGTTANSAYLTYTIALGGRRAATATAVRGSGVGAPSNELYATYLENPPVGPGAGWRLGGATTGDYDADFKAQFEPADAEVEAARNQGVSGQSLYVRGAATLLDGMLGATRSLTNSFAVVDVGGIADVPVYLDNQLVAHTDSSGHALLPNLRAFEPNRVGVDPVELPLATEIDARMVVLAPGYRTGVVARFPVTRIHGGTFRLVMDDGKPVPAGASVAYGGAEFPVAMDGTTYITTYAQAGGGRAHWDGTACTFTLPAPPADDVLPDLGTIHCAAAAAADDSGRSP